MARRKRTAANGDGTIYPIRRRNSKQIIGYRCQITLPNGKRLSISGKKRDVVKDRMGEVMADLAKGVTVPDEKQTFGEFLPSWLEIIRSGLQPSTHRRHRNNVQHILDAFARMRLVDLKTSLPVQQFYAKLSIENKLAPKTVRNIHGYPAQGAE